MRALRPTEEQDTLVPCPVCAAQKTVLRENRQGRYQMIACRWCQGVGSVPPFMFRAYQRWTRIHHFGRMSGRCE